VEEHALNYEKTKELVKSGHQLVVLLGKQNGMHEAASLVQRMAGQLDVLIAVLREKTKQCDQLAAENAGLKGAISQHAAGFTVCEACGEENVSGNDDVCRALNETPATKAFLREVKSQARQEGAYFVANRMLAAWDAGFIEDTAKNAADIARMILTSTEFMADAPDGDFDRAFADSVLAEIASELHQGGAA